jgi:hypothetical protein
VTAPQPAVTHGRPKGLLLFLTVAVVIGMGALVLSLQNAVTINTQADQRERERIASDYAGCLRGNDFRSQTIAVGEANEQLVAGILDVFLPAADTSSPRGQNVAAIRAELEPKISAYRAQVHDLKLIDCDKAVPGHARAGG